MGKRRVDPVMWGNLLSHVTGQETPLELPELLKQGEGFLDTPSFLLGPYLSPADLCEPCYPHILPTYIQAYHWPAGGSTPRVPWKPPEIHTVSHKSHAVCPCLFPGLTLLILPPGPLGMFFRVDSSLDCPSPQMPTPQKRTSNLHPSSQPYLLRNMFFCLTKGPLRLPSISPLPQVALQPLPAVRTTALGIGPVRRASSADERVQRQVA